MDADIRILSTDLTEALQSYIERRLHFSLGRFGRRVGRVRVRITDVNGPRGGPDKSCHISAELLPSGIRLLQRAADANLYAAIGQATEGIGRSFARALGRNRERRRKRETVRFSGSANPKCEGECRAGRVQRSRSLDPQGYGGGNSRNRDERENDSGNTRRHGEADDFACISPEIADAGPGAP